MPSVRCRNVVCGAKLNVPDGKDLSRAKCPRCKEPLVSEEEAAADFLAGTTPTAGLRDRSYEDAVIFSEAPRVEVKTSKPKDIKRRYPALRAVSFMLKLFALIAMAFFVHVANENPLIMVQSLMSGLVSLLVLYAFGELINVFLDIESNTRP